MLKSAKLKFLLLGFFQDKNDIITPQEYALLERVLENWIWPFLLTFFLLGSIHPHYFHISQNHIEVTVKGFDIA